MFETVKRLSKHLRLDLLVGAVCGLSLAACATPAREFLATGGDAEAWTEACEPWDDWDKAGPAYQIYGASYYVGTCGIASILITGDDGHILIDGGSRGGGPLIAANVEALGYDMTDVKILLHSHEHFDHVGGLSDLQRRSGAQVMASGPAAPVLRSGAIASDDPQAGMHDPFEPVPVDRVIADGDTVTLGDIQLTAVFTPGHSPGALSWSWRACEAGNCKTIVYMDSLSAISSETYRFTDHPAYVAQYKSGIARLSAMACDIVVTPHPSASDMTKRLAADGGLVDPAECARYVEKVKARLNKRLETEAQTSAKAPRK